jgi:bla regulator protein blaR1
MRWFVACCLLAPAGIGAQTSPVELPAFEVASIKPAPADATGRSLTHNPGARLVAGNATLRMLVLLAYQVMPPQISGGPAWFETAGFDIDAKAADPKATPQQFRQMIQRLLADRFAFLCHFETRQLPVYELIVAKGGSKLAPDTSDNPEVTMRNEGPGQMTAVKATMAMFAGALERPLRQKVVDATGLQGAFTFKLEFAPEEKAPKPGEEISPGDHPPLIGALHQQLGLTTAVRL